MPMYSPFAALLTPMPFDEGVDTLVRSHGSPGMGEENPRSHAVVRKAVGRRVKRVITTLLYFCSQLYARSALATNQSIVSRKFFIIFLNQPFISRDYCMDLPENNLVSHSLMQ